MTTKFKANKFHNQVCRSTFAEQKSKAMNPVFWKVPGVCPKDLHKISSLQIRWKRRILQYNGSKQFKQHHYAFLHYLIPFLTNSIRRALSLLLNMQL
jgi:hypothetical protein